MESMSDKTSVILLKRGGRIWANERQANVAKEAKLSGEGVVDIDGQLIEVNEIRAIVNGETYRTTREHDDDERRRPKDFGTPPPRSDCSYCQGTGFTLDHTPRVERGIEYGPTAIPCEHCNPNPPEFKG